MKKLVLILCVLSVPLGITSLPVIAQDYNPHKLKGTLTPPKLGWRYRGKYTVELSPASTPSQFKMEICPTYLTSLSPYAYAKAHKDYSAIAKIVCQRKSVVLIGKLEDSGWIGHGGSSIENIIGEFQCK